MADVEIHKNLAISAGAVFIPVCAGCVGLRLYARRLQNVRLGADDYTIMGALLFVVAMGVTLIAEVGLKQLGYPTPEPSTTVGKPDANVAFWPVELLQVPALGLIKLSFILFYRRIFTKDAAWKFNWVAWFMLAIITAWTIAFFFAILFICGTDFSAYWTSTEVEAANCTETSMLHNAFAISDVVIDVLIIILPLPMVWRLHLTLGRKLALIGIFMLGALALAASLVRMVMFVQLTSANYSATVDFELLCTAGLYWSMIEAGLALCAACLPASYSLVRSKGLQGFIRSVQSALSLRSLSSRSRGSGRASGERPTVMDPGPSADHIVTNAEGPARNNSDIEMGSPPTEDKIVVTRSVDTVEQRV
ncbi:MAG: hypothetical protein M1820_009559 [Bogoriella megaspora]|nr:MAG: hypothetical protein M1820_009559 [Bogoriella megaspora]